MLVLSLVKEMQLKKKKRGRRSNDSPILFLPFLPPPLLCSLVSVYVSDFYTASFRGIEQNKKH